MIELDGGGWGGTPTAHSTQSMMYTHPYNPRYHWMGTLPSGLTYKFGSGPFDTLTKQWQAQNLKHLVTRSMRLTVWLLGIRVGMDYRPKQVIWEEGETL